MRILKTLIVIAAGLLMLIFPLQAERNGKTYTAHLSGVDSSAQGQATFKVADDGESLEYKLIVANLEDIIEAHIHLAPVGKDGPAVVWLYPSTPPALLIPGRTNGILAEGSITAAHLVGPLADKTMVDLIKEIKNGNAYVNVHTSKFPAGEIRGQIK